jgi:nucleoside-diphosphate-sugar epimerase
MAKVLGNETAIGQIYNISGDRYVTFNGLAAACAEVVGKSPEDIQLVHYDPAKFDFGKRKAFPMRQQHFFADIHRAQTELNWQPQYDLVSGLKDSFQNDYLASGRNHSEIDFSLDEEILGKI